MRALFLPFLLAVVLSARAEPVNVIFDTDFNGDVDDVGALGILNQLTTRGEAHMVACVTSAFEKNKSSAATIHALNSYYGHADVPIGTYKGTKYGCESKYDGPIHQELAKDFPNDDQLPSPLEIYRKALAAAPDGSITIVTVGFLENLQELMQSPADAISPLTGAELVKRKVKQLVAMAGAFPQSHGAECNMSCGSGDGGPAAYICANWPTPILFSGFEIGGAITTGVKVKDCPANDPVRRAYELYNNASGRPSWDPTAVLAAVRDPKLYWDVVTDGSTVITPDGNNTWTATPHRGQSYLVVKMPPVEVGKVLDELMTTPPK